LINWKMEDPSLDALLMLLTGLKRTDLTNEIIFKTLLKNKNNSLNF
jgi:hypothetical protein